MKLNFFPLLVSSSFGPIPHGFFATTISPSFMSGIPAILPFSSSRPGPIEITAMDKLNIEI